MADAVAGRYGRLFQYTGATQKFSLPLWLRSRPMAVYGWLLFKLYYYGSFLPSSVVLWLSVKLLVLVRVWHLISTPKKGK